MILPAPDLDDAPSTDAPGGGVRLGGKYLLLRVVGSGGMGVVWEARNTWTQRRVAVKVLSRPVAPGGTRTLHPDVVERFMREARATAKVRHPNVVDVLDMGHDADRAEDFIVYEFLDGETLRALLGRRGRLGPEEAARCLLPVMDAVSAAHGEGVVHRDLKPENVLLVGEPGGAVSPRVIDFGVAQLAEPDDPGLTRTGAPLGTARYMSPEQCRGARDVDARADVWSMGVIWYEALAGAHPYAGGNYNEVIAQVLTTDAPSLAAARPELPRHLVAAVDRALSRDRDARHPSMDAFLAAVRDGAGAGTAARSSRGLKGALAAVLLSLAIALVAASTRRADRAIPRAAQPVARRAASPPVAAVPQPTATPAPTPAPPAPEAPAARPQPRVARRPAVPVATVRPPAPSPAAPARVDRPAINGAPIVEP